MDEPTTNLPEENQETVEEDPSKSKDVPFLALQEELQDKTVEEEINERNERLWKDIKSTWLLNKRSIDSEIYGQAANRTLLILKEVLIKATEMKLWREDQFKLIEEAIESSKAYRNLLESTTENQLFTLLNISKSLGEETYNLFKSLLNCQKLKYSVSEGFKQDFSDLFPTWTAENPPEELKSEIMEEYLKDLEERRDRSIKKALEEVEGYLDKEIRSFKEARAGLLKIQNFDNPSEGLISFAKQIKEVRDAAKQAKIIRRQYEESQAAAYEMSKDASRREVVSCMQELNWHMKVLDEAFFNCNDKREKEDLEVLTSSVEDIIEKASYFKNILIGLYELLPNKEDKPDAEPIKEEVGNNCFSEIDQKNLYNAWANQPIKECLEEPVEEEDEFKEALDNQEQIEELMKQEEQEENAYVPLANMGDDLGSGKLVYKEPPFKNPETDGSILFGDKLYRKIKEEEWVNLIGIEILIYGGGWDSLISVKDVVYDHDKPVEVKYTRVREDGKVEYQGCHLINTKDTSFYISFAKAEELDKLIQKAKEDQASQRQMLRECLKIVKKKTTKELAQEIKYGYERGDFTEEYLDMLIQELKNRAEKC